MSGRPLRIAIDTTQVPRQRAGAGVYTYELVRALAGAAGRHRLVVFARAGLFDDLAADRRVHLIRAEPPSRPARLAWEQTVLPVLLRRLHIDVLHSPHHHTPIAAKAPVGGLRRTKLVVTFHDVTFMLLPQRYPLVRRLYMQSVTRTAARVADAIITPSLTVRRDVIERLGVAPERVVAIPEAPATRFAPQPADEIERVRARYGLPERYVLSVGSLEPGKNRETLLRACALLREKDLRLGLVVAGQPAWNYERDEELAGALGLRDAVRFLGYVPDDDMPGLYAGAALLAFPSLYEGFGLPVLEAMACGTPVVTSNVSATAEVAGDAALLVGPRDAGALAGAIEQLLCDGALRSELRRLGLERAGQFSWQRAARETLLLYELVASQ